MIHTQVKKNNNSWFFQIHWITLLNVLLDIHKPLIINIVKRNRGPAWTPNDYYFLKSYRNEITQSEE